MQETAAPVYPTPKSGASLLISFRVQDKLVLIVGGNVLAASRAFAALEAGSKVVVLVKGGAETACEELRWRAKQEQITLADLDLLPDSTPSPGDVETFEAYLRASQKPISLVCVTDTVIASSSPSSAPQRSRSSALALYKSCQSRSIPINITDMPDLCDFTFTATHRFIDAESGEPSGLQVGVTTNGEGCRLAGRVRREIVGLLPRDVGSAVRNVGKLRNFAKGVDGEEATEEVTSGEVNEENGISTPNAPVPQRTRNTESLLESQRRRMKWVAQVSEYWPISRLASMTDEEMRELLNGEGGWENKLVSSSAESDPSGQSRPSGAVVPSQHSLPLIPPPSHPSSSRGRILLVGSGPGHPSLLTIATHTALTKHAQLVLSDKLVPAAVLALIPPEVEVRIAKKFPGNAEGAQNEMMEAAVEAARSGVTVVRLKQGDPMVYGRAGEEVLYFRAHGFEPIVIPGLSSALVAPAFAGIPVTQRGVAESFIVCTGVGRQGKEVKLPGYERSRTLLILMGVARLPQVLKALLTDEPDQKSRNGPAYPENLPIAIIERASMPDQRVIASTLRNVERALEGAGEQRPPGMIVVGWSVLALEGKGDVSVLDQGGDDEERVGRWLGEKSWKIRDGLDVDWDHL
ncbi:hypothetical protein JAAARDRAFT_28881 [Jaapia argillacea MUCL 33604]|uniref:precorrin-2 dehydrogenase n=1 Tax=Jaapia argillacea MUCL 33604 TaxID=933084 RepID=A0A067QJX6_9AGAM|nr:hypothetical protein JAAARDRAFT_28881 [Jaapia argillacea MUCL 33604]